MLIKKQHKTIFAVNLNLAKLNTFKQQCSLRTQTLKQKPTFYTSDTAVLKNQKIQLAITLSSFAISQVKDISHSTAAIEKLIYYINSVCAKQLHTAFDLSTINPIISQKGTKALPTATILGSFTANYTNLLHYQKILLLRLKKQQYSYKVINYNNNTVHYKPLASRLTNNEKKSNHLVLVEKLERSNYFNRWFFKLSKEFSNLSTVNKRLVQRKNSKKRFTVIRAPFVFKKTREQFCLQKLSSHVVVNFTSPAQKHFLIQNLRLLKLPTELKLISRN